MGDSELNMETEQNQQFKTIISNMESIIREVRNTLFMKTEHRYAHERVWETEEEEERRESLNKETREAWDKETEQLIKDCYHE